MVKYISMKIHSKTKKTNIKLQNITVYYEHFYREDTNLPTLLLIHGFLSSSFSFRRLIPYLQNHFNIIAVDIPPFGKSEKKKNFYYSFSSYSDLLASFCEKLNLKNVTIVGHSLGGQIALQVAKRYPVLVEHLILLCSSGYIKRPSKKMLMASYLPMFKWYMKKKLAENGVRGSLVNIVYDKKIVNEELEIGYTEPFLNKSIFDALLVMYRKLESHFTSDELKDIHTEVLLLWGKEDKVTPISVGKKLNEDLPNSKLIIFEKAGHLLSEEIPDKIAEQMIEFQKDKTPLN